MYAKIYAYVWIAVLAIALIFLASGNLTPVVTVAFGFLAFGLVFMGMMSVLPSTVGHHAQAEEAELTASPKFGAALGSTSQTFRNFGADLTASNVVDIRKAKFH